MLWLLHCTSGQSVVHIYRAKDMSEGMWKVCTFSLVASAMQLKIRTLRTFVIVTFNGSHRTPIRSDSCMLLKAQRRLDQWTSEFTSAFLSFHHNACSAWTELYRWELGRLTAIAVVTTLKMVIEKSSPGGIVCTPMCLWNWTYLGDNSCVLRATVT